jgi:hypothetical protein
MTDADKLIDLLTDRVAWYNYGRNDNKYHPPYILPNGDILIRRNVDDQEAEDDGISPANAEFV